MRRIVLLLVSAFCLYGCGGGSGAGSTSSTNGTSNIPSSVAGAATSSFTINLQDSTMVQNSTMAGVHAAALISGAPVTKARVVVRQFQTVTVPTFGVDEDGNTVQIGTTTANMETYRKVHDVTISSTGSISFDTPVSLNDTDLYQFDVLTYVPGTSSTPNIMAKFGTISGVQVGTSAGATNSTTLVVSDLINSTNSFATYTLPSSVKAAASSSLTVTTTEPLASNYDVNVYIDSTASTKGTKYTGYSGSAVRFMAPNSNLSTDSKIYFSFTFYINSDMLDQTNSNDTATKFVRPVPSTYSDSTETSATNAPFAYLVSTTIN